MLQKNFAFFPLITCAQNSLINVYEILAIDMEAFGFLKSDGTANKNSFIIKEGIDINTFWNCIEENSGSEFKYIRKYVIFSTKY